MASTALVHRSSHPDEVGRVQRFLMLNFTGKRIPLAKKKFQEVIRTVEGHESCFYGDIELVFLEDQEMLELNRRHLNHDYITDILTFPLSCHREFIEATICCCLPQIKRQSRCYGVRYGSELMRIFIHGLLHLAGYKDKTESERIRMSQLEDHYLTLCLGN